MFFVVVVLLFFLEDGGFSQQTSNLPQNLSLSNSQSLPTVIQPAPTGTVFFGLFSSKRQVTPLWWKKRESRYKVFVSVGHFNDVSFTAGSI